MYHKKWIVAAVAFVIAALYADGQEQFKKAPNGTEYNSPHFIIVFHLK